MIYNTTWAIFFFIPILYVFGEFVFVDQKSMDLLTPPVVKGIFLISSLLLNPEGIIWTGVIGYLINIAIFLQMKMTSPLTGTISGTVKGVLQVLFGWLLFRNEISLLVSYFLAL